MRAIVVRELGGPEVLRMEDVAEPRPEPGEVAVSVEFIGVNFTDVRNRVGDGLGMVPFTPGVEVSGTVSALGPGVESFRIGQRVAAFTRGHAYAEVVTAAEIFTVALPDNLAGRPDAAGMLVTVPLAVNVVERAARIRPGETVLLHAAAGGVGSVVGQLLRELPGVTLWGTVSDLAKAGFAREHGYGDVMTYADFATRVTALTDGRGVDVVLDPVGGDVLARSLDVLAPFGRLVSYSNISRAPQALPDAEWASRALHRHPGPVQWLPVDAGARGDSRRPAACGRARGERRRPHRRHCGAAAGASGASASSLSDPQRGGEVRAVGMTGGPTPRPHAGRVLTRASGHAAYKRLYCTLPRASGVIAEDMCRLAPHGTPRACHRPRRA